MEVDMNKESSSYAYNIPASQELTVADRHQSVIMLVRLLPQNSADFNPKALNDKRRESGQRKRATGGDIKNATTAIIIPFDNKAMRVVVPLKSANMIKFYALINPDKGLCTGYNVP
ncbi:hypothetical protein EMCG_00956 [[Emmonsia] crescens]|uniref:Uncharacterized protein n=1 Tax=[Emmonsia] crescens TaxID=73230 RepID=A0A0G2HNN7_9EURO|nr:hypothetical protein EMCG_00956 [Emmonsia crescens UAMH 3008]